MLRRKPVNRKDLTLGTRNDYLDALERFQIEPNFWCSEEYFQRAGWRVELDSGIVAYVLEDQEPMLSPVGLKTGNSYPTGVLRGGIWAGFPGDIGDYLLDYNFIYDPKSFLDLSGGKWQVFRKNSRKYPNRFGDGFYTDRWHTVIDEEDVKDLFISWLEGKEGEIHDDEVMLDYLLNGDHKKVLIDDDGKIVGINVWDENYRYVNFRHCVCDPGKFLSEYMRLLFYTDPEILSKNKLVNDGGALDSPELYRFKMKLNPIKVNEIYSWRKK